MSIFFTLSACPWSRLQKVTPLWIPFAHFWTVLTGIVLVIGGGAMFARNVSRQSAAALGAWVVLLVVSLYLAIMISKPDIEGLNYFADTLMFGGVLLVASRAYERPAEVTHLLMSRWSDPYALLGDQYKRRRSTQYRVEYLHNER